VAGLPHPADEATIAALLDARRTDGISIAVGESAPGVAGFRLRQCEELLGRSIKQRRFETEAVLRPRELLGPAS
jgi:hypothetical protein